MKSIKRKEWSWMCNRKLLNLKLTVILSILVFLITSSFLNAESINTWHWRNPVPQGNTLKGVSYGNGVYLALGERGTVISSNDGINWNTINPGISGDVVSVAYGKGYFVAITRGDYYTTSKILVTSNNGATWSVIDKGNYNFSRVKFISGGSFGDGIFFVTGRDLSSGKAAILTASNPSNPENWVSQDDVQNKTNTSLLTGVAGGVNKNGEFIVVAVGLGGAIVASSNGTEWMSVQSVATNDLLGVAYGNGIFVAVGSNGVALSSEDGTNWVLGDTGTWGTIRDITYGGGKFVAVFDTGKIATSTDGKNWVLKSSGTFKDILSVCYGTKFVAVGQNSTILTSQDGISWTESSVDVIDSPFYRTLRGIIYANGLFVTVGDFGTILTSSDGVNWTKRETWTDRNLYGISYGEGRFVAVGDKGTILTSTDGIEWMERYSGTEKNLRGVTYGKGMFVVVGEKGSDSDQAAILTSVDGISWFAQTSDVSMNLVNIAYGNGMFAAVGTGAQTLVITSSDGINWIKKDASEYVSFDSITYGDNRFIGVGIYGKWMGSGNGVDWTYSYLNASLRSIIYVNETFFAVGGNGDDENVFYPEGQTWKAIKTGKPAVLYGVAFGNDTFVAVGANGTIIQSDKFPYAPLSPSVYDINVPPYGISQNSATIKWKTQEPVLSQIEYRKDGSDVWQTVTGSSQETNHSITLTGLSPETLYYYRIVGVDKNGEPTRSGEYTFMTVPALYTLTVTKKGTGSAIISAEGLSCNDGLCTGLYTPGKKVEIRVSPDANASVLFWTNECSGSKDTCTVTMDSDINITIVIGGVYLEDDPLSGWIFRNPIPQGNTINALTFGNNYFVAVGDYGTILTSSDGQNWVKRYADTTENLVGIGYGNGLFVAIDKKGAIIISPDGVKWTKVLEGSDSLYLLYAPIAYGNGVFIAQTYKTYLISSDGINWFSTSGSTQFNDIIYCNGLFIGGTGSEYGGQAVINVSYDGFNWIPRSPKTGYTINALTCSGNNIFAVSRNGDIFKSSDGVGWEINNAGTNTYSISDVAYGNGKYVAVGGNGLILASSDGSSWTKVETGSNSYFKNVAFGNNIFIATGQNGAMLYSADGVFWNVLNKGDNPWINGIAHGNYVYVAVGNDGVMSSTDRKSWTKRSSGQIYGISFINGRFVAVGHYDTVLTSVDGIQWDTQNVPKNGANLYGATFGKNRYIVVGGTNTGIVITSTDASTWTNVDMGQQGVLSIFGLSGVAYGEDNSGNGKFVAVGNGWDGQKWSGIIFTSSDGLTWSLKHYGVYNAFHDVLYADDAFYVIGGSVLKSTDLGETWVKVSDVGGYGLSYANKTILATGSNGTIYTSSDKGLTWKTYKLPLSQTLTGAVFGDDRWIVVGENGTIIESLPVTSISRIALTKGWNFVSFPSDPENSSISAFFGDTLQNIRVIWGYDNETKGWKVYKANLQGSKFPILETIESGKGYWIYMNAPFVIDISNWSSASKTITLSTGWNLIGWNGADGISVMDALYTLGDKWEIIWGWENGKWKTKKRGADSLPEIEPLNVLNQGRAYWIKMNVNATWSQ